MAENIENNGCSQRDNAEHEGYVKASRSFNRIWKERDSAQPRLLEAILYKDNFNRAYKRVKANKGAPGIDGMTIEEALPYLKEHQQELTDRIYRGKYTPSPVRRVEIPKPDGGVRKLGIPTVIDRTLQQAITQQLVPIYEPLFAEGSYGYRPNRSAKDAILKVKEYAEQGYTFAVVLDLSKYFDTLNHEILINLLRKNVKDERVVQLIKRYLKSGVMENGVVIDTEEGSPQGGNLSPLLANVYLNEFDQEFLKRGVPCIRYADDINGWLYHRIRMCIWKQWKKPRTKVRNLINMGVPKDLAMQAGNTRRGHWFATHTVAVNMAMTKERLINSGFYDLATAYQSVHVNY